MNRSPERLRLYLLFAWFHAIVMERLRYSPLAGFSKRHEFSASDAMCGLSVIDHWFDTLWRDDVGAVGSEGHIDPHQMPWDAIKSVLGESIYGGRVDNEFDQRILWSFLDAIFVPEAFSPGWAPRFSPPDVPRFPTPGSAQSILAWADDLPDNNPATWIGLSYSAETILAERSGKLVLAKLALLQADAGSDSDDTCVPKNATVGEKLILLEEQCTKWASNLRYCACGSKTQKESHLEGVEAESVLGYAGETVVASLSDSDGAQTNRELSLAPCISREISQCEVLLRAVLKDLQDVRVFCKSSTKLNTARLQSLVRALSKGGTPREWSANSECSHGCTALAEMWLNDFGNRCAYLFSLANRFVDEPHLSGSSACVYWLGGFSNPRAFITASRQYTAQVTGTALGDLVPTLDLCDVKTEPEVLGPSRGALFKLRGLLLQGAAWDSTTKQLVLLDAAIDATEAIDISKKKAVASEASIASLRWVSAAATDRDDAVIEIPVYLNEDRKQLLLVVKLRKSPAQPTDIFYRRGTAIIAWSNK
jgi:dynein heavy chain 1